MGLNIVTFDGTLSKKSKCIIIDNEYYILGDVKVKNSGQCLRLTPDGEPIKLSSGEVVWDHENNIYDYRRKLIHGVVSANKTETVLGYFSPNLLENVSVITDTKFYTALNQKCLGSSFKEDIISGWFSRSVPISNRVNTKNISRIVSDISIGEKRMPAKQNYRSIFKNTYNVEDDKRIFEALTKTSLKALPSIKNTLSKYEKNLFDYSIGIELETIFGKIPMKYLFKYGLIPLRDGSINGFEYTSIPYRHNKKLSTLKEICEMMSKRTGVNKYCSFHIHFGNVNKDKLYIIALYMLCYQLQHELHEIVPPFKKDLEYLRSKKKDHCKFLNSLSLFDNSIFEATGKEDFNKRVAEAYSTIFSFLNENNKPSHQYNKTNQSHVKSGQDKWNFTTRYYFVNFLNLLFSKRGTIEFRLHHGTVNKYKIIYWTLINSFILKFAENNIKGIINKEFKVNLSDIITQTCKDEDLGIALLDYIRERKSLFLDDYMNGNLGDTADFINDPMYVHNMGRELGI